MDAAALIRAARQRQGLSQAQLADRAGTSQPVISAYENAHRSPSMKTLRRLVAATGEQVELRLADRVPGLPVPADAGEHSRRFVDVLLLADAIPSRRRRARHLDAPRMLTTR